MPAAVSVIIPTYNQADYIEQSIKSVLSQTEQNYEIIIMDGCSCDSTKEIVQKYVSDKIRYFCHDKNLGPGKTFNDGLAKAQYEDKKLEGAYNFGPDDESCITTGGLTDLFCKAWGNGARWKCKDENGPHEANFLKLDNTKAKRVLNWHPRWTIKTAIEKTVEWEKNVTAGSSAGEITDRQIKEYF